LDRERGGKADEAKPDEMVAKSSFRHGDGASRIVDARLMSKMGQSSRAFRPGEAVVIRVRAVFHQAVSNPVVGILIRNRIGMDVFGTNTRLERMELGKFEPGEALEVEFEIDCLLARQEYTLTVATQYWNGLSQDWLDDVLDFRVVDTKDVAGVLNLNTRVRYRKLAALPDSEGSGVSRS
jgi:lipopolysaccharide transport system ATP-binding protein